MKSAVLSLIVPPVVSPTQPKLPRQSDNVSGISPGLMFIVLPLMFSLGVISYRKYQISRRQRQIQDLEKIWRTKSRIW